jgi:hypothetical protein
MDYLVSCSFESSGGSVGTEAHILQGGHITLSLRHYNSESVKLFHAKCCNVENRAVGNVRLCNIKQPKPSRFLSYQTPKTDNFLLNFRRYNTGPRSGTILSLSNSRSGGVDKEGFLVTLYNDDTDSDADCKPKSLGQKWIQMT